MANRFKLYNSKEASLLGSKLNHGKQIRKLSTRTNKSKKTGHKHLYINTIHIIHYKIPGQWQIVHVG
ncbi:hypothetical protein DXB60_02120 [Bacteroides fragilis]|uniref:Uncharacterized protein n=1 Tax=Bacteroides fragilis TaxID=817 RepID=A0A0I9UQZ8_BACFG|nr:hypothetical protein DXB60_02120 [Bacteroides fragilis]